MIIPSDNTKGAAGAASVPTSFDKTQQGFSRLHIRAAATEFHSVSAHFDLFFELKAQNGILFLSYKQAALCILKLYLIICRRQSVEKGGNYHDYKQKRVHCLYCKQLRLSCPEGKLLYTQ